MLAKDEARRIAGQRGEVAGAHVRKLVLPGCSVAQAELGVAPPTAPVKSRNGAAQRHIARRSTQLIFAP
jgi:hypothetical protein